MYPQKERCPFPRVPMHLGDVDSSWMYIKAAHVMSIQRDIMKEIIFGEREFNIEGDLDSYLALQFLQKEKELANEVFAEYREKNPQYKFSSDKLERVGGVENTFYADIEGLEIDGSKWNCTLHLNITNALDYESFKRVVEKEINQFIY